MTYRNQISDEQQSKLIELYFQDKKYRLIASLLTPPTTAKAVTGRIDRLVKRGVIKRRVEAMTAKQAQRIYSSGKVVSLEAKKRMGCPTPPKWEYVAPLDAVSLMDLKHTDCRFPFDNDKYCGKISARGSYCLEHAKVCYGGKK